MIFEVKRRENEDSYIESSQASGQTQQSGYFSLIKSQGLGWELWRESKVRIKAPWGVWQSQLESDTKYVGIG